jgi:hypothetical protein
MLTTLQSRSKIGHPFFVPPDPPQQILSAFLVLYASRVEFALVARY